jgi:hypothetical protein
MSPAPVADPSGGDGPAQLQARASVRNAMPKLRSLAPLVRPINTSRIIPPPKLRDPVYATPEFRAWRAEVVARASGRCEAIDHGRRCSRAQPEHRMYADHIQELKDGGLLLDINNGQCLCSSHHTSKTMSARAERR